MPIQPKLLIWDLLVAIVFFTSILFWDVAKEWLLYQQILYFLVFGGCLSYFYRKLFPKGIKIIWRHKKGG